MKETWLTVKEAALCCKTTERAIQIGAERGKLLCKYVPGKGRNGQQLRISLESLSPEAQYRYLEGRNKPAPNDTTEMLLEKLPQDKRYDLDEKVFITEEYIKFRDSYPRKDHVKQFVKYMKKNYPMFEFNPKMLSKWALKYEEFGISGLVDLRGSHNRKKSTVTPEMQEMFLSYYLTDKEPTIQQCYKAVKDNFNGEVPSISSFKRFLKTVPLQTIAYFRKGKKFFEDNCLPTIQTDYDSVPSNYEWVADHHQFDVIVKDKQKVGRPWLSAWLDRRSRYIVGYVIRLADPNSDTVMDSLVEAVKLCGVPDRVQTDNGKDYVTHDLFNRENDYSLAVELNTVVRRSIPYNAKAKSIERTFKTLEALDRMLSSYCGDRPEHRAESLSKKNEKLTDEVMTFSEFLKVAEDIITIYNNTPQNGKGMNGRSPYECYKQEFKGAMRKLGDKELLSVMRRRTRTVTVTKNGVKFAELGKFDYYEADFVIRNFRRKVYAKYFTSDTKMIHVYDAEDDSFLGVLPCKPLFVYGAGADVQKQTIRENERNKQKVRQYAKLAYPSDYTAESIESVYARRAAAFGEPDFSDIPTMNCLSAEKRAEIEQITEIQQEVERKAMKKYVLPVEDDEDNDYESKLSRRRFSNG